MNRSLALGQCAWDGGGLGNDFVLRESFIDETHSYDPEQQGKGNSRPPNPAAVSM